MRTTEHPGPTEYTGSPIMATVTLIIAIMTYPPVRPILQFLGSATSDWDSLILETATMASSLA